MPSMLSNERFSSIRTTKWSMLLNLDVDWAREAAGARNVPATALPQSLKKSRRLMAPPKHYAYFLVRDQLPWRPVTRDRHEPSNVPFGLRRKRTTPRSVVLP